MKLYSLTGATSVTDPHTRTVYERGPDGGFEFPEELGRALHRFHVRGKPMWEDDIQMRARLVREEEDRRRDPKSLLTAVEQIIKLASGASADAPAAPAPKTPRQPRARKPAAAAD